MVRHVVAMDVFLTKDRATVPGCRNGTRYGCPLQHLSKNDLAHHKQRLTLTRSRCWGPPADPIVVRGR